MPSPIAEITAVAHELDLGIRILPAADRDQLRERIGARYSRRRNWMWEDLPDRSSVQDVDGWQRISRFVGSRTCILLFDVDEEVEMFEVPSGEALESLLANTFHFEFYVTDLDASYLICFNHHDMLIGCGTARPWVERLHPQR